ncbi:sigma-70 family RNA polymerase sigma factor [Lentisphaera profundi]|uniref:Sigma-70 family RNA polymerase sigma factor n=1 Tax=Lentisphaera profundi TaxID=1658616 RepID=A0ABY7VQJ3_9BACT|nr:sigma-70 family RNA polymerase sigma factor [Lentisphaera profundi]WDE96470.1 sigma-70 family RNA polymerase sigma factor [Lentisphaera profundi]
MSHYPTNQTLLQRVKNQHDDDSWDEFNSYYRPFISMIVASCKLRSHDISEVVQLVMIRLWKSLPKFNYDPQVGNFRGWLTTITYNAVRNYVNSKAYKQSSLNNLEESHVPISNFEEMISESELDKIAEREWGIYICELAWNNIKESFESNIQEIYPLLLNEVSPDDIAEKLDIKRNTVYVYKKRLNKKLFAEIRRLNDELN